MFTGGLYYGLLYKVDIITLQLPYLIAAFAFYGLYSMQYK